MAKEKRNAADQADELYYPPAHVVENANVKEYESLYRRSLEDPEGF